MRSNHPILRLTCPKTKRVVYCGWSNSCDAPSAAFANLEQVRQYLTSELENDLRLNSVLGEPNADAIVEAKFEREYKVGQLQRRIARLEKNGHTLLRDIGNPNDYVKFNRAGANERSLSLPKLVAYLIKEANDV